MAGAMSTGDALTKTTLSNMMEMSYDLSDDESTFRDLTKITNTRDDKATLSPRAQKRKLEDKENDSLNIDTEVKIVKKRKPNPKLDDERLLSQPGLPALRALAQSGADIKKKLRLKGNGHEFNDCAKLLGYYQLWLDNLYPRAKFADALMLVEKAGHGKRMQVVRKGWIEEGKPGYKERQLGFGVFDDAMQKEVEARITGSAAGEIAGADGKQAQRTAEKINSIFGDGLGTDDDLFVPDLRSPSKQKGKNVEAEAEIPADDELDALLAEQLNSPARSRLPTRQVVDEDDDDLDALLAEQDSASKALAPTQSKRPFEDGDDTDGEDGLDALLAEQDFPQNQPRHAPTMPGTSSPEDDEDDLDALLAEQDQEQISKKASPPQRNTGPFDDDDDDDEEDELGDLQADEEDITPQSKPSDTEVSKGPGAIDEDEIEIDLDIDGDELDALMDEQEQAAKGYLT